MGLAVGKEGDDEVKYGVLVTVLRLLCLGSSGFTWRGKSRGVFWSRQDWGHGRTV